MKLGMTLPIGVGALGDGKPVPWTVLREIAKRGEEVGFDSVMLPDHLLFRRSPPGNNPAIHRYDNARGPRWPRCSF